MTWVKKTHVKPETNRKRAVDAAQWGRAHLAFRRLWVPCTVLWMDEQMMINDR